MNDREVFAGQRDMAEPRPLPYCSYPGAADVAQHGIQPLPAVVPLVDFLRVRPNRRRRHAVVPASRLAPAQIIRLSEVVATSFAPRA